MATMIYLFLVVAMLVVWIKTWSLRKSCDPQQILDVHQKESIHKIQALRSLTGQHEVALKLCKLVEEDGAGTWPPRADHDAWPLSCRPYKDIYFELCPLLSSAWPSLEDEVNIERQEKYRSLMRNLLSQRIDLGRVEELLTLVEAGHQEVFPRDQYNGVYCCIAVLRHAYRWATIPVVRVAQLEKVVDFPRELDLPWLYLQRKFGVDSDSGNVTSNLLHNFNQNNETVYKVNSGLCDSILLAEEVFCRTFWDMEQVAFTIYLDMVQAIITFDENRKATCTACLKDINLRLRDALRVFYRNLTESRISRTVWLQYVQGFQAWGVGRMVDGQYVKYDGLSGSHVLLFQALDAFLGMDRYLPETDMHRYIPANQRELCLVFKKHSFRAKLNDTSDMSIQNELNNIVNQLQVFRKTHRARATPYLGQPAPERLAMTAGKSVIEGSTSEDTAAAFRQLDCLLAARLDMTR